MTKGQTAIISDVHGNRWALEAVLIDIERRGIGRIVNLGDSLFGPLDPAGTAWILLILNLPTVRGNEDRIIVQPSSQSPESPTLRYVRRALSSEHLEWLESLPMTAVAHEDLHLCHGSLTQDDEYLLWEVSNTRLVRRSPSALGALVPMSSKPILLCGHDHVPRTVHLPDGRLVINPGSVGLPAYADDVPISHTMETGTPHARYSVVSKDPTGWQVEDVAVPYDWDAAAKVASENDRPDWAEWLRTGRATWGR